MNRFSLRRGAPGDLDRLVEIENAVFETDRLSRRALAGALTSAASCLLVADLKGRVAGYCLLNFRSNSLRARLFSLARAPETPAGCGRALLAAAEQEVLRRGRNALRLEVRETNARAIRLYECAGYRRIGRHDPYYEDGAAALRFEKVLARTPNPGP